MHSSEKIHFQKIGRVSTNFNGNHSVCFRFNNQMGYECECTLNEAPTNNCQMFCIGDLENLLNSNLTRKEVTDIIWDAQNLYDHTKPLMLFDIRRNLQAILKKYFDVLEMTNYHSTNGHDMCFGLIKINYHL